MFSTFVIINDLVESNTRSFKIAAVGFKDVKKYSLRKSSLERLAVIRPYHGQYQLSLGASEVLNPD